MLPNCRVRGFVPSEAEHPIEHEGRRSLSALEDKVTRADLSAKCGRRLGSQSYMYIAWCTLSYHESQQCSGTFSQFMQCRSAGYRSSPILVAYEIAVSLIGAAENQHLPRLCNSRTENFIILSPLDIHDPPRASRKTHPLARDNNMCRPGFGCTTHSRQWVDLVHREAPGQSPSESLCCER